MVMELKCIECDEDKEAEYVYHGMSLCKKHYQSQRDIAIKMIEKGIF